MTRGSTLLEVEHVSKTFARTKALDDVSLSVSAGEVVAVAGQNGSGKSTLVKVLAGVYQPDDGAQIRLATQAGGGAESGPAAGARQGATELHFIHQDLGLVDMLTAVENLDLSGPLGRRALRPNRGRRERDEAEATLRRFGVECDVTVPVGQLPATERAIVAIARALSQWTHDQNVLVLDEPTASLHGKEADRLFAAVRRVADRGAGVIFISHRLDEIFELAERVVVLRDGRVVAEQPCAQLDHEALVRLIAGRADAAQSLADRPAPAATTTAPALRVRGLHTATLGGFDLDLRQGEIVGIGGVHGSGREDVAPALFGASPLAAGEVSVSGVVTTTPTPRWSIAHGLALVPAERPRQGAVLTMNARENLTLPRMAPFTRRFGRLDRGAEGREVDTLMSGLDVRPPLPEQPLSLFSGGNQQKVVLAKWLRNKPSVLLLDEPTQGVDVGAKAGIYEVIARAADTGTAVLVCSSDSRELARICDRVIVLRDGVVAAELCGPALTEEALIHEELGSAFSAAGASPALHKES
ncbi:sugar ABC transporter ATP-binding protein [Jatrophihabitans fulvus]